MHKDLKDALFMFAVSNSCVNPLVYGSYTMNIQQMLSKYFKCCRSKKSLWRNGSLNNQHKHHPNNSSHRSVYIDDNTNYSHISEHNNLTLDDANESISASINYDSNNQLSI